MASLCRALAAGLLAAAHGAAPAGDLQSLVQKDLGVHRHSGEEDAVNLILLKDSLEEPPHSVVRRITLEVEEELPRVMTPFMENFIEVLGHVFAPLSMGNKEPLPTSTWTPEEFTQHVAGLLVAFRDPKFAGHLTQSVEAIAEVCKDLGEDLDEIGQDLDEKTQALDGHSPKASQDARYWVEHSLFQGGDAVARASGRFSTRLAALLRGLPTKFLQDSAKTSKARAETVTERSAIRGYRAEFEPQIKSKFFQQEASAVCSSLAVGTSYLGELAEGAKIDAPMALLQMKEQYEQLEPYVKVGAPQQAREIYTVFKKLTEDLGSSLVRMGAGIESYSRKLSGALPLMKCPA